MNRRDALRTLAAAASLVAMARPAASADTDLDGTMETHTYKTVGDIPLMADVYRPSAGTAPYPVVLCIHGGALMLGGRHPIQKDFYEPLLARGFVIVSIDYRLAPETMLPEIIADVQDAYRWIRTEGPALFGADPDRIGVQGGSAGGYLTLMTGFCVEPRPKALVSSYGYGDIIGDWYSKPDPFYCAQPAVSEEAAYRVVGEGTPTGNPLPKNRKDFYLYCRQQGLWPKAVSGVDPATQPDWFTPYCPVQNVTAAYPPTFLGHGDDDTDVPYEQSVLMAAALEATGVEHEFITLDGAGHGFSHRNEDAYQQLLERSIAFMVAHVTK